MKEEDDESIQLDDDQADCMAGHMVNIVGVDEFKKAGIEPEDVASEEGPLEGIDLDEKQASAIYDSFGKCGVDVRAEFLKMLAEQDDLSPEVSECFEEALTDDVLRVIVIAGLQDLEDESPEMMAAMGPLMGCLFMSLGDMDFGDDDFDFDFDDEDFDFDFDD